MNCTVFREPEELMKSVLLGNRGIKKWSTHLILVYCRKLQTSEDQMAIPEELIRQAEEVPVDTTVVTFICWT